MPSSKVVKISESGPSEVLLSTPESVQPKLRFAKSEYPLIQTSELTYSHDNDMIEFFCTPEHADYIHQIDDILCTKISENSEEWFGQKIPYDQIERMFRPTLIGGKNPRQSVHASNFKAFDANTKPTNAFPPSGSGIFIIKLDGVNFEEKVCEAKWSLIQAKECVPVSPPSPPLFV